MNNATRRKWVTALAIVIGLLGIAGVAVAHRSSAPPSAPSTALSPAAQDATSTAPTTTQPGDPASEENGPALAK